MKKITTTLTILLAALTAMPVVAVAQDPFDDLYYSPSKAAEKKKKDDAKLKAAIQAQTYDYTTMPSADVPAADTYTVSSSKPLNIDVDAYNRRYATSDIKADSAATTDPGEFTYTRRIERYHNPEVVTSTGDQDLIEYYYSSSAQPDVNVYVLNVDPWYNSWGAFAPYYGPYGYYSYWGPRWSFNWGYNPWYGYGWYDPWYYPAYGPSWGWGGSWGWHHPGPGPRPPHGTVRPPRPGSWASGSPGASRPHRPAVGGSNTNRRPGYTTPGSSRPGNNGLPGGYRPGNNGSGTYRPSATPSTPSNNSNARPSNNSRRGQSTSGSNRSNSYNSGSNRSNSGSYHSTPSYRGSSGGSYRSTGGGGSRGGGSRGRR